MKRSGVKQSGIRLIEIFSEVAGIILIITMMVTVADVFLRTFFLIPLKGAWELNKYFMAILTALGLAWCTLQAGHIDVTIISSYIPKKINIGLDKINYYVVMAFSLLVVIETIKYGLFVKMLGKLSDQLNIPEYIIIFTIALGFFLVIIAAAIMLHKKIQEQK